MHCRRSGAILAAAVTLLVTGVARAQTPTAAQTQLAQTLFDEAKKLMAENNFAQACPKLAESQHLDPSGGTLLHLGICHESQGKVASAYSELSEAISVARRDGRTDRETVAKAHLAAIASKLVRLTVTVAPDAKAPGLEITWNGAVLPEAQWGAPFPVDPGEQVITASAPGRRKWSTRVDVPAQGPGPSVAIPALPAEASDAAATHSATLPAPAAHDDDGVHDDPGSSRRTIGLVVAGAGVVALGAGIFFELRAHSLASERDDAARAGDAATTQSKDDSARASQTAFFVAGGLGAAALIGGGVLFFTAPSRSSKSAVALAPTFGRGAGGIAITGPLSW